MPDDTRNGIVSVISETFMLGTITGLSLKYVWFKTFNWMFTICCNDVAAPLLLMTRYSYRLYTKLSAVFYIDPRKSSGR